MERTYGKETETDQEKAITVPFRLLSVLRLGGDSVYGIVYVNLIPPFWSIISSVAQSALAFLKLHP